MTIVYFIRHAEAEGNLFKRIHGQYDSPVTQNGWMQIRALTERFHDVPVDAIYTSDLKRTRQTAQLICEEKAIVPVQMKELREIDYGSWEDLTFGYLMLYETDRMMHFASGDLSWKSDTGESLQVVQERMFLALEYIVAENPGKTVLVFSHGTAIRLLMSKLSACDGFVPEGMNTGVSCVIAENRHYNVKYLNDHDHLKGELLKKAYRPADANNTDKEDFVPLLWFRPWDEKTEQELYQTFRKEGWYSSHHTYENYDGDAFLEKAKIHSNYAAESVLVVMNENNIAGILELDYDAGREDGYGMIWFYYLKPEFRCKGMGIQLLGQAISSYRMLGRNRIRLRCAPENGSALRFYLRNGFEKRGYANDSIVRLYLMERTI